MLTFFFGKVFKQKARMNSFDFWCSSSHDILPNAFRLESGLAPCQALGRSQVRIAFAAADQERSNFAAGGGVVVVVSASSS